MSPKSVSLQRRCSASCCRPRRLCAVSSTPPPFLVSAHCHSSPRAPSVLSAPADITPCHGSLASTELCGLDWEGRGTYTAKGLTKLCEGLKQSAVTSLECATRVFAPMSQRPLTFLSTHLRSRGRSLSGNIFGLRGERVLANGLKGNSSLRNLMYAAPVARTGRGPFRLLSSAPIGCTPQPASAPMLAVSRSTSSALEEEALSPSASVAAA